MSHGVRRLLIIASAFVAAAAANALPSSAINDGNCYFCYDGCGSAEYNLTQCMRHCDGGEPGPCADTPDGFCDGEETNIIRCKDPA